MAERFAGFERRKCVIALQSTERIAEALNCIPKLHFHANYTGPRYHLSALTFLQRQNTAPGALDREQNLL